MWDVNMEGEVASLVGCAFGSWYRGHQVVQSGRPQVTENISQLLSLPLLLVKLDFLSGGGMEDEDDVERCVMSKNPAQNRIQ